jgi:hypothetical protein
MKRCTDCRVEKPLTEFYKHPQMADGTLGSCKVCRRKYANDQRRLKLQDPTWVAAEAERQRKKELKRYHEKRKFDPEYQKSLRASIKRWADRNPEKKLAQNLANNAVRDGRLTRKTECEECGGDYRVQKHHDDYAKPLEVRWLCTTCHGKHHRKH